MREEGNEGERREGEGKEKGGNLGGRVMDYVCT